jgi:hypothetical protein
MVAGLRKANEHARFQEGEVRKASIDGRRAKYTILKVSDEAGSADRKLVVLLCDFEIHGLPPALGRVPSASRKRQLRIIVSLPSDCQASEAELEKAFLAWVDKVRLL